MLIVEISSNRKNVQTVLNVDCSIIVITLKPLEVAGLCWFFTDARFYLKKLLVQQPCETNIKLKFLINLFTNLMNIQLTEHRDSELSTV